MFVSEDMIVKCLLILMLISNVDIVRSQFKQLHIVFRHGERAPTETYNNDPYKNTTWSGGWGQLTNRGKLQMYSLGLKLRKIYSDFIPEYYFPEDIKVFSSYADRCLMSAETLLAALFPPKNKQIWNEHLLWQPIPVHYVPRSQDNLIAMKASCKNYDEQLEQVLKSDKVQGTIEEHADLLRYLTEHTGQNITSIGAVELLYNTLEIEVLHNLTLPEWTSKISLVEMKRLAARSLEIFTETDFMKRMKGGVFLKNAISSMEKIEKNPVVYFYSAHDLTLVNILKTLGYKQMLKPGFGASFVIELHNNTVVSMVYRDDVDSDPEEVVVERCSKPCTLNNLKVSLEQFLPSNWDSECTE